MKRLLIAAGAALMLAASVPMVGPAAAQTNYPEQTVRIVVGYPPGVSPDIAARLLGDKFSDAWGKPVVIENVTGAGSNIATDRVAKSPPASPTGSTSNPSVPQPPSASTTPSCARSPPSKHPSSTTASPAPKSPKT